MQNAVPARRGSGLIWSFMRSFSSEVELKDYLIELDVTVGRVNINSSCSASKLTCKKSGCGKQFRVIRMFDLPEDTELDSLYIEEEMGREHDHTAAEIILRGLSKSQKGIVLDCFQRRQCSPKFILSEFERLAAHQRANNGLVVPTPRLAMITSFLAYHKKQEMGGIPVGQTTLQDLENFADEKAFGKSKCSGT